MNLDSFTAGLVKALCADEMNPLMQQLLLLVYSGVHKDEDLRKFLNLSNRVFFCLVKEARSKNLLRPTQFLSEYELSARGVKICNNWVEEAKSFVL